MEVTAVAFIVLRTLARWYSHPQVQHAHHMMDEHGIQVFLVQLEAILLEMERLFPGVAEAAIVASMPTIILREDIITILKEVGVTETQIKAALAQSA